MRDGSLEALAPCRLETRGLEAAGHVGIEIRAAQNLERQRDAMRADLQVLRRTGGRGIQSAGNSAGDLATPAADLREGHADGRRIEIPAGPIGHEHKRAPGHLVGQSRGRLPVEVGADLAVSGAERNGVDGVVDQ